MSELRAERGHGWPDIDGDYPVHVLDRGVNDSIFFPSAEAGDEFIAKVNASSPPQVNAPAADPPWYLALDVWMAMGLESEDFNLWAFHDDERSTWGDRWSQLLAAIRGADLSVDTNPPAGRLQDLMGDNYGFRLNAPAAVPLMSAANRRRGHDAERSVVKYLKANGWPDAMTTRSKLGHDGATAPGDVDFHPLVCLEVKDVAASSWPSWCRQAAAEAREGMVPVVVRRTRGVPDVGLWECRVSNRAWCRATDWQPIAPGTAEQGCEVDGEPWFLYPFASFVAALSRFDAIDQGSPAVRTYAGDS